MPDRAPSRAGSARGATTPAAAFPIAAALRALLTALVLALGLTAPSAAAGAPKPVKAIVYKQDLGRGGASTPPKTVLNRDGLKLEASCEGGGTFLSITVPDEQGRLTYSRLNRNGAQITKRFEQITEGTTGILTSQLAMGEMIYQPDDGRMLSIDALQAKGGLGRDCSFSALVRSVDPESRIELGAGDGGTREFEVGPGRWDLICNSNATVVPHLEDGQETSPGMLGVNFQDPADDEWIGSTFSPFGELALNVDSTSTIMDQVLSLPDGSVATWRGYIGNPSDGCFIDAFGRTAEKGPNRAFYAARIGSPRKKIYDAGGLELYATCRDDGGDAELQIFAKSTGPKNAILKTNVFGFGNFAIFGPTDLDPARKPQLILDLPEGAQTGQLMYARPDGKVTAMNWAMSGDTEDPKPCQFTGLAGNA